ncbi:serine carboxypeptidase [Rhizodiscina lignyota]|uniref:Serine carboxypeptidase n=1 Tax=Rhizodiscina lignyota TaxID=1504668 RepID=A0A9P4ME28_9PEZI|nr:serine carboxypeptidase [Rhizodiscina lignyota]
MWHLAADEQTVTGVGNTTFLQLIDHNNPSLGTFEQFYMYDTTYYKGPGSPIVLFTPGEVNASAYTTYLNTNRTTGVVAKEIGAATIVLEHRYWGTSTPYTEFTTENLKYLTLDNAIHDLTYFAKNAKLPFDHRSASNAQNTPWVLIGGSYSGALSAWVESVDPGTFWAYHASSAPTEAVSDYWGYFLPVQEGMPKNCSKDVNLVIEHMDNVLKTGTAEEIHNLKAMFGLESVEHNDDFMAALEWAPWLWQDNQFYTTAGFYIWCDYIENSVNQTDPSKLPGEEGVGLEKALEGYAKWGKDFYFPDFCQETYGYFGGGLNTECFNTYNKSNPIFTDITPSNTADRQWVWMTCNEPFGYWQDGAPEGRSTLVSRLVNAEYWIRQCDLYFPPGPDGETFGINKGKTEADVNKYTGGWDITKSTRLQYTNGGFDPWREATVSSELRPGGPLQSTEQVPVHWVPGGFHTSDLVTMNGVVNASCKAVIDAEVAQLVKWVNEWPKKYRGRRARRN